ncbi:MAG TPA: DUF308 domain-containing protein [Nitrososphaeraceae archaeon]|nr:DUF308 domain-containing protein [Nitrososphaeraceae archaeon]
MTLQIDKSPGWMRGLQIGLGALAIILSGLAIAFPGLTFLTLVILVSIVLFVVGIEKIITGIFIAHKSRFATIGLGILTIILAGLALSFPIAAAIVVIYFLGFALMFDGFARIIDGVTNKTNKGWIRGFLIGVGVLNVIISALVLASPLFGAILAGIMIGLSLLIVGIEMIAAGVSGRQQQSISAKSQTFGK